MGAEAVIIHNISKGAVVWTTAPLPVFQVNIRCDEGEKYRRGAVTVSGGEWKPRTSGCGKNTPEQKPERQGPVGGPGYDRYIVPACWSWEKGLSADSKLGGTAERSIRPKK